MSELYWITVVGKLNTVFWVIFGFCATTVMILSILYLIEYEEDHATTKKFMKLTIIGLIVCGLGGIIIPGKNEAYVIYGAGTIMDYCKSDSKVKEIPDKAVDALNRYLDSISSSDSVSENKKDEKCQ